MKISENFQQFVKIFLFFKIIDLFLVLLPNIPTLKYKFNAEIFFEFWGDFQDFCNNSFLEIPRGP